MAQHARKLREEGGFQTREGGGFQLREAFLAEGINPERFISVASELRLVSVDVPLRGINVLPESRLVVADP